MLNVCLSPKYNIRHHYIYSRLGVTGRNETQCQHETEHTGQNKTWILAGNVSWKTHSSVCKAVVFVFLTTVGDSGENSGHCRPHLSINAPRNFQKGS